jgi:hypothetical protein
MTVNRSNIVESKFLDQSIPQNDTTSVLIETLVESLKFLEQALVEALGEGTDVLEWLGNKLEVYVES